MAQGELGRTSVAGRRPKPANSTQRLNVVVPASVMATLHELADSHGVSLSEMVRRSIQLMKVIDDAARQGCEVQVVEPATSKVRTLHFI